MAAHGYSLHEFLTGRLKGVLWLGIGLGCLLYVLARGGFGRATGIFSPRATQVRSPAALNRLQTCFGFGVTALLLGLFYLLTR